MNSQLNKHLSTPTAFLIFLLSGVFSISNAYSLTQDQLRATADSLKVKYQVKSNLDLSGCDINFEQGKCYQAELRLTFANPMPAKGWDIYFSQVTPIQWEGSEDFDIERINGDLHKLSPTRKIIAEKQYVLPLRVGFWSVSKTDVMPNYFIVADGLTPAVINSTVEEWDEETGLPILPHAGEFKTNQQKRRNSQDQLELGNAINDYHRYASINTKPGDSPSTRIIPKAKHSRASGKWFNVNFGLSFSTHDQVKYASAIERLAEIGLNQHKMGLNVQISINSEKIEDRESYQLRVMDSTIDITADSEAGAYYALMSLSQLYNRKSAQLPIIAINDSPEHSFRGLHIDVARNFHSKGLILRLLNQMAALKLNKLHLHLADDEGWRVEIPGLPELTEIGAFRCFDLSEQTCLLPQLGSGPFRDVKVNGFYSQQEYVDIVKYAAQRHIEVIPSLDMPGHSRAAVKSMQARHTRLKSAGNLAAANEYLLTDPLNESRYSSVQYYDDNTINPCIDSTYNFIAKVLSEVAHYHELAGFPLKRYHIGADETAGAWVKSPACQKLIYQNTSGLAKPEDLNGYFINRIASMLAKKGIVAGAWSDGAKSLLGKSDTPQMQVNLWGPLFWEGHNEAHEFINEDWKGILSIPDVLYFDFPYSANANEPGYYWASRSTDSFKVFQLMPNNLPAHASFWLDRLGVPYTANRQVPLLVGKKIAGIQAQMWSETTRSDKAVEYMLFPRLVAMAERAWHKAKWATPYDPKKAYGYNSPSLTDEQLLSQSQDWADFSNVFENKILPHLIEQDIVVRIPPPGAIIVNGILHANSLFPGLHIYYKSEKGDWKRYFAPVSITGKVQLKTVLHQTSRASRTVEVSEF